MNERGPTYETADGLDGAATESEEVRLSSDADEAEFDRLEDYFAQGNQSCTQVVALGLLYRAYKRIETLEAQVHELRAWQREWVRDHSPGK